MRLVVPIGREHLEDAAGNVYGSWIKHGVVIGEGNVLEHHLVVIFVE